MARKPIDKRSLNRLAGRLGARYIRLVERTSTILPETTATQQAAAMQHPCIFAFWHGQFLMIPAIRPPGVPVANMVARHGDAELIGEALKAFDMELIRGSGAAGRKKDRGGATALRAALKKLRDNSSIAMTADIPPGPARQVGLGVVKLAQLSGCPIIPVATASSRFFALNTWSRMTINLPFSRIGVTIGEPIVVSRTADDNALEAARLRVQHALNVATEDIYARVGADITRATPHSALSPDAPPEDTGLKLNTYRLATRLAARAAPLILRHREKRGKEDPARLTERMGVASAQRSDRPLVWVHAASVGETNAVLPLINCMRGRRSDVQFLLTTGTVTSASMASENLSESDIHQYAPLDAPQYVERFLDHWQPGLAILTESELWPNTIIECHRRGIPLAIVNGRMSDRSYRRWRRNKGLALPLFSRLRLVLAQNARLARRFGELGARDVRDVGNLKIDAPPLPIDPERLSEISGSIGNRPVWLAASTHEGEEEVILAVHDKLTVQYPDLLTIVAPRHPERGGELLALAARSGRRACRRTETAALPEPDTAVYIADTIGEMGLFYALAPIAFIGGSLAPRGGHNPIEAVRFDTAVITGPDQSNFSDAYAALMANNGAIEVADEEALTEAVSLLLRDEVERARLGRGALAATNALSGAMQRTVDALMPLMPTDDKGLRRAS